MSNLAVFITFLVVVLMGVAIWSIRRHRDPKLDIRTSESIDQLIPSLAGLGLGTAVQGNSVEVLQDEHFYDVVLERIRQARKTVHFETFLWKAGDLSHRMAEAFAERARAGVTVRVLLDAAGSRKMGREARRIMEEAGCKVVFFHKRMLHNIGILNDRDHRKIIVIDGREAFVGGHCIVDTWIPGGQEEEKYRDVSVHLRGPIVNTIQSAFSENWAGESGELFVGESVFPQLEPAGNITIHAAYLKPEGSAPAVKILHYAAICVARKRIWIQNPYFIPDPEAIEALGDAVDRGVDVRVMMPSVAGTDNAIVQHAGHRNFSRLLRRGVRLFEYPHTLVHQKIMTIDGVWSAIGSSNFDDRSFETNDEITLGILDTQVTAQLDAIFEKHVSECHEIQLGTWEKRPLWHKLKDHACYSVNELL